MYGKKLKYKKGGVKDDKKKVKKNYKGGGKLHGHYDKGGRAQHD